MVLCEVRRLKRLHQYTLSNGLRIWFQPNPASASVAALIAVRSGLRYEAPANNGISHMVEHMLFAGTERWTAEEIREQIPRRGGRRNAWTGLERTVYFTHVSAQDLDVALEWLSQVVFHPTFPAEQIERERRVIVQERRGRHGWLLKRLEALGLRSDLSREVRRALFPGASFGLSVLGQTATLAHLDRATLLDYYRRHYTVDNVVLVVVGNVTAEEVLAGAERQFGQLDRRGRPPAPPTPPLPAGGPQRVVIRGPTRTARVRLRVGARTVARTDPDRWPLEVLARVLRDSIREEVRYRRGLVYGLRAYNTFFDDIGSLTIATSTDRGSLALILGTIEEQLEQIGQGTLPPERIEHVQAAMIGRWALSMESNARWAMWLARWSSALLAEAPPPDYSACVEAVTPADLARVVQTYFTPQRRYLALHLPIATAAGALRAAGAGIGLGLITWAAGRWLARRSRDRP